MRSYLLATVTSILILSAPIVALEAQEADVLKVADAAICLDVVDRMPVSPGDSFTASVGKLYCFTRITGARSPTEIAHVWYYGNAERFRLNLAVGSVSWRTYTSKRIQSHEIGAWHVEVLGPDAKVLHTLKFEITP